MAAKRTTQKDKPARRTGAKRRVRSGGGSLKKLFGLTVLAASLLIGGYFYLTRVEGVVVDVGTIADKVAATVAGDTAEVTLYFADPQWTRLVSRTTTIPRVEDKARRIRRLVELLIQGPQDDSGAVLPPGAEVREVYLGPGGLVVVDFEPTLDELRSYGAGGEMLSVFAIVHTICENEPSVKSVQILVGGEEQETLAGHVRISEPLAPRPDLTAGE